MALSARRITIFEMFVITVLLAAVASVLAWQHRVNREEEIRDALMDDLRNLATAQEGYAADHGGAFMPPNLRITTRTQYNGYAPSSGVTVSVDEYGQSGWSATATHETEPGVVCGIFVGDVSPDPPNPATRPGEPDCS